MSHIQPEYYTVNELLNYKFFEIPNYQRTYSWTKKQREDLFNDISNVLKWRDKERHHFMSTIVCLNQHESKNVGTDKYNKYYIVDGQQRITSLIILLKALSKSLKNGRPEEREEYLKLESLLVKKDQRIILLQTNHDNQNIFFNYLSKGEIPKRTTAKTFTDRNMIDAFTESESFIKKWRTKNNLLTLLQIIKNRLGFIFYVLKDAGSVYRVFEVLNSRGLVVDWLDKVKSSLMGIIYDKYHSHASKTHIEHLHKTWISIYSKIGLADIAGHEIVRFSATLLNDDSGNKPLSAEESLDYFLTICNNDIENVFNIVDFISKVTERLKDIYSDRRLKAVTDISQARLLAVAIKLSRLDDAQKNHLLLEWEKISFRIFGLFRKDSRTAVGDYVRLAKYIIRKDVKYSTSLVMLEDIGKKFPASKISEQLLEKNCYEGWEEEARYFFFRYEEYLAKNSKSVINEEAWSQIWAQSPLKSIEHIYPKTPQANWNAWKGKLGKSKNVIEKNKHRLGNLMLLTPNINSSCGTLKFEKKKEIYKRQLLRMKDDIIKKKDWNIKTIIARERKLIAWAKDTWG
jgi:hypothetical protein